MTRALNDLPGEDAERLLFSCFADRDWAAGVAAGRPYRDLGRLLEAAEAACEAVRQRVFELAHAELERRVSWTSGHRLEHDSIVSPDGNPIVALATLLGDTVIEETREFRPRVTSPLEPETGQADAHVQYAFAAHRAVVDVDVEPGACRHGGGPGQKGGDPQRVVHRLSAADDP